MAPHRRNVNLTAEERRFWESFDTKSRPNLSRDEWEKDLEEYLGSVSKTLDESAKEKFAEKFGIPIRTVEASFRKLVSKEKQKAMGNGGRMVVKRSRFDSEQKRKMEEAIEKCYAEGRRLHSSAPKIAELVGGVVDFYYKNVEKFKRKPVTGKRGEEERDAEQEEEEKSERQVGRIILTRDQMKGLAEEFRLRGRRVFKGRSLKCIAERIGVSEELAEAFSQGLAYQYDTAEEKDRGGEGSVEKEAGHSRLRAKKTNNSPSPSDYESPEICLSQDHFDADRAGPSTSAPFRLPDEGEEKKGRGLGDDKSHEEEGLGQGDREDEGEGLVNEDESFEEGKEDEEKGDGQEKDVGQKEGPSQEERDKINEEDRRQGSVNDEGPAEEGKKDQEGGAEENEEQEEGQSQEEKEEEEVDHGDGDQEKGAGQEGHEEKVEPEKGRGKEDGRGQGEVEIKGKEKKRDEVSVGENEEREEGQYRDNRAQEEGPGQGEEEERAGKDEEQEKRSGQGEGEGAEKEEELGKGSGRGGELRREEEEEGGKDNEQEKEKKSTPINDEQQTERDAQGLESIVPEAPVQEAGRLPAEDRDSQKPENPTEIVADKESVNRPSPSAQVVETEAAQEVPTQVSDAQREQPEPSTSTLKRKKEDTVGDSEPPAKRPREEDVMDWTTAETCEWLSGRIPHIRTFLEVLRKHELTARQLMVIKESRKEKLMKRVPELRRFDTQLWQSAIKLQGLTKPKGYKNNFR
ncbi:unnamed protein product [Caenorhabditis sp. 36 PRJEB53466]|nr:unnamed protein product [Caenorhabditis sp. 36 PRJEB53466]